MFEYDPSNLPKGEELPSVDFEPADDELHRAVPFLLLETLYFIWRHRNDIFFAIDMGYYYDPGEEAISPDAFLSVGVETRKDENGRLSYVLWEEDYVKPILVLECVSQHYRGEYDIKKDLYAQLGILYYVIYDGDRYHSEKGEAFEVHRLENGVYVKQSGEPVWLPEIGLGIGRECREFNSWTREWLYWYDQQGNRYLPTIELLQQLRGRTERT
ncbi:MAG: Uma2 family endonuclease [Spirulinaceae cyanobacterium]